MIIKETAFAKKKKKNQNGPYKFRKLVYLQIHTTFKDLRTDYLEPTLFAQS